MFTLGIFFVKFHPILEKKLLKASAVDLGSLILVGVEPHLDLRSTSCIVPFQTFLESVIFAYLHICIFAVQWFVIQVWLIALDPVLVVCRRL